MCVGVCVCVIVCVSVCVIVCVIVCVCAKHVYVSDVDTPIVLIVSWLYMLYDTVQIVSSYTSVFTCTCMQTDCGYITISISLVIDVAV